MQSIVDPVLRKHQLFVRWSTEALLSGKTRVTCICTHIGGTQRNIKHGRKPLIKRKQKRDSSGRFGNYLCTALHNEIIARIGYCGRYRRQRQKQRLQLHKLKS